MVQDPVPAREDKRWPTRILRDRQEPRLDDLPREIREVVFDESDQRDLSSSRETKLVE